MDHDSPINTLIEALASAVHRDMPDVEYEQKVWNRDMPDVEYEQKVWNTKWKDRDLNRKDIDWLNDYTIKKCLRRPFGSELDVVMFSEMWGSTALGYGGIGGAAMTNAYTVIVYMGDTACVYFGGGLLAYRIQINKLTEEQNVALAKAISSKNMPSVREALNTFKGAIEGQTLDEI